MLKPYYQVRQKTNKRRQLMSDEKTTIQVTVKTKARLDKIGFKKDTYDDIVNRLLDQVTRKRK